MVDKSRNATAGIFPEMESTCRNITSVQEFLNYFFDGDNVTRDGTATPYATPAAHGARVQLSVKER
jgi:hypothetical protein